MHFKDSLPTAKTLGILWRAQQDVLTFQAKKLPEEDKLSKRIILSKVAGVFDPLGLAGPFVVCAKILLQEMWTKGLDWDEPIDHELSSRAKTWFSELDVLQEISVPRCLQESKPEKSISVQTFVDASSEVYGAVSYLRSEYAQGCYVVRIIASKTTVCPLSPMSTPKLEMMAAVLGLRLTLSILAVLDISIEENKSRSRHNVEGSFFRCTIFRLAKPAFFRYNDNFTLVRDFFVACCVITGNK